MKKSSSNSELKQKNSRIMKWREMLQQGLFSDKQLLLKRTRKGIPDCLRIKIWPQFVKTNKHVQRQSLSYSKILYKQSKDIYQINLDIPRTFMFQSQQILRKSLFNVLKALSIEFPQMGYCQGMNFLVMRILETVSDETCYQIVSYILKKHTQIYDNFRNPGYVTRQNQVLKHLLQKFLPKISKKLSNQQIQPVMYTPSWFITLYSKSLSSSKFYRFFDCFLFEGYSVLYKTALALLKLKQKQILSNTMEQNFLFISNMEFYENIEDDVFVDTFSLFNISDSLIAEIQKKYESCHRGSITRIQNNIQQTYQKKKNNSRMLTEWTPQDFQSAKAHIIQFND